MSQICNENLQKLSCAQLAQKKLQRNPSYDATFASQEPTRVRPLGPVPLSMLALIVQSSPLKSTLSGGMAERMFIVMGSGQGMFIVTLEMGSPTILARIVDGSIGRPPAC